VWTGRFRRVTREEMFAEYVQTRAMRMGLALFLSLLIALTAYAAVANSWFGSPRFMPNVMTSIADVMAARIDVISPR